MQQTTDNTLDILVILDRSGSMSTAASDHEGGLAAFVKEQQALPGDVRFTLVQFDSQDPHEVVYDRTPIAEVGAMRLVPRGGTPLYDAIGMSLAHLEKASPAAVICMIITDGEDTGPNREWNRATVQTRIEALQKAGWTFLFLAANIDAFAAAANVGVASASAASYSDTGPHVQNVYNILRSKVAGTRREGATAAARGVSMSNYMKSAENANYMSFTANEQSSMSTGTPVAPEKPEEQP